MNLRSLRPLYAFALLLLPALAGMSCSVDDVLDPGYVPEGVAADSSALLILWPEIPVVGSVYSDQAPIGPGLEDVFIEGRAFQRDAVGTFHGMVLDHTIADEYEILRTEPGGGMIPLFDFNVLPRRSWLDRQWEAFRFDDRSPSGFQPPTYQGRGVVSGAITPNSPLTNRASQQVPAMLPISLFYTSDTTVSWNAVPAASYYIAHIYNLRQATPNEQILSGQPAPIYIGQSRDFFIGLSRTPGELGFSPVKNILKLGTGYNPIVLTARDSLPDSFYELRVTAVDSLGQLIGFSSGDSAVVTGVGTYVRYPKGSRSLPRVFN
jgi:hypothetical protein